VQDPARSAAFYSAQLGAQPVEAAPTFVLFALSNGLKLGLWQRAEVQPKASGGAGATELCIAMSQAAEVDSAHAQWLAQSLTVMQAPTAMDFGYTAVVADPDGHRLRVFAPQA
jgi:predicted enzyme related to lactoylglutathione lyase